MAKTENPGTQTVSSLLENVRSGAYVIPYFQRGFEWQPGMICDLVQSILQDYYTGLILLWDLKADDAEEEEWDPVWGAELRDTPEMAILDGQQRLASLYYAIYNPARRFPNRKSYYVFFLHLTHILNGQYEEAVSYRYYGNYRSWEDLWAESDSWAQNGIVPMPILSAKTPTNKDYIASDDFIDWIEEYFEANRGDLPEDVSVLQIPQILSGVVSYNFVVYPLSSDRELPDICNIFARVNEKGMKLSTFDLMNAFLYPKGVKLRKELWEGLDNERLKDVDSNMNEYLLKLMSLVRQNYCSSKYIYNLIPGQKTLQRDEKRRTHETILVSDGPEFEQLWSEASSYAERARQRLMNTGEADFGAVKTEFIPNTTLLPVLGAILWTEDLLDTEIDKHDLTRWYWAAVLSEDYSGSSDTIMARDFRYWRRWLSDGEIGGLRETMEMVDADFVENLDLRSVKRASARYNAVICMLALNDCRDFFEGQIVGRVDYSNERINDHHIFPSGVKGLAPEKCRYFGDLKDTIVNRTLLFDETNRRIRNRKPSEYVSDMISKWGSEDEVRSILQDHLISSNAFEYMKADDFDNFVDEREKTIQQHIVQELDLRDSGQSV